MESKDDNKVAFKFCFLLFLSVSVHASILQDPTYDSWWPPHSCRVAKEALTDLQPIRELPDLRKPQASADAPKGAMACEAKAMTCHAKLGSISWTFSSVYSII